jgi:hypothetical protein
VILRDPVSVDEEWLAGDATVRLAPNPASSTLRLIAAPDAVVDDIEIYNVLGSRVGMIPAGMLSADISSLAAGAYEVRARVNGQLTTLPLSITR